MKEGDSGEIWVSDKSNGIIKLNLNAEMDSVIEEKLFAEEDGLPSTHNNYVYEIDNKIVSNDT